VTAPARTVFLGSGAFAVPVLARLAGSAHATLAGIVTAPPRASGRGGRVRATPVAAWAEGQGVPILTPERLRSPQSVAALEDLRPELLVLADYGQLVPAALVEGPRHGALNLHPSLLPRHRGAAPIPAAILAGDTETGVTLMRMDAGLDTGPIVAQRRVPLAGTETAPELEALLAHEAAELLAATLPAWLAGTLSARPQPATGVTLTRPLRREDGRLDPSRPALDLERQVRAYQPWPGSFLETEAGRLTVWSAAVEADDPTARADSASEARAKPGWLDGPGLTLRTADGWLSLLEVQPAGGRRMTAEALLRGRPGLLGSRVGAATLR
jgi:methionyl-tRNA formyltransferase